MYVDGEMFYFGERPSLYLKYPGISSNWFEVII
jgi:hypothetical protein